MAKERKLDLSTLLSAIDKRDYTFYKRLDPDAQKEFSPLVIMRFMSSAPDKNGMHEFCLLTINEFVNKDLFSLSKHPELVYMLLCLSGTGKNLFHKWIKNTIKEKNNALWIRMFREMSDDLKDDEVKILRMKYTKKSIHDLALSLGKNDKEANDIKKSFD